MELLNRIFVHHFSWICPLSCFSSEVLGKTCYGLYKENFSVSFLRNMCFILQKDDGVTAKLFPVLVVMLLVTLLSILWIINSRSVQKKEFRSIVLTKTDFGRRVLVNYSIVPSLFTVTDFGCSVLGQSTSRMHINH